MLRAFAYLFFIATGISVLYYFFPEHDGSEAHSSSDPRHTQDARKTLIFFVTILGVGAAVYSALVSAVTLDRLEESLSHPRREAAFKLATDLRALPWSDAAKEISTIDEKQSLQETFRNNRSLHQVADGVEELGLAARVGFADEAVLCEFYSDHVQGVFSRLWPLIERERRSSGDDRLYENGEWIYRRWILDCPNNR